MRAFEESGWCSNFKLIFSKLDPKGDKIRTARHSRLVAGGTLVGGRVRGGDEAIHDK